MKNIKRKSVFILISIHLSLFVIACVFLYVYNRLSFKQLTKDVNIWVGGVVSTIQEKYPDITEEEILYLLNTEGKDNDLLKKIGINEENVSILTLEKRKSRTFFVGFFTLLVLEFMVIALTLYLYYKNNKTVNQIIHSVKELNKKNYVLEIEEQGESELSILKNELYKITVMLKEESENASDEKKCLSKAVEDISHQLKTPLTSIRILLDNLEETKMDEKTRKECIRDISKQLENMNFLTITLLKLARFDAGVIVMKKEPISATHIFSKIKSDLAILLELKNQKLLIEDNHDIELEGDYNWQVEAFTNIIKNCSEHSKPGSVIEVFFHETPFYSKIQIQDHGEGISKKDIKHIFERFYKSSNASRDSIGIGLSLAKTIIEENNGYITCKSEEGVGTTFEIKYAKK